MQGHEEMFLMRDNAATLLLIASINILEAGAILSNRKIAETQARSRVSRELNYRRMDKLSKESRGMC